MTREEIYGEIHKLLVESFELEPDDVKPEAQLYEELGLDSIDAVDIFVSLRELTGRRPDPEVAKNVRTVDELVDFVISEIKAKEDGVPEPDVPMPNT